MSANWVQQYIKKIIHHDQVGFIPEWKTGLTFEKSIHVINELKNKNHMTISTVTEEFVKIQHVFLIKTLNNLGTETNFLNLIMGIFEKPTASIVWCSMMKGWKLSPLRPGTKQGCLLFLFLLIIVLITRGSIQCNEARKEIKGMQIRKGEVKLSLCIGDVIVYTENPMGSTKKLLEIRAVSKTAIYKINI